MREFVAFLENQAETLLGVACIGVFVVVGCWSAYVFITSLFRSYHQRREPSHREDYRAHYAGADLKDLDQGRSGRVIKFIAIFAICAGLFAGLGVMQHRDKVELAAAREQVLQAQLERLGCPKKRAGDTDIITLTFDTTADLHTDKPYRAAGCARIVERGWVRSQAKRAIAAAD